MADANMFFPCDNTPRLPIAMTKEYLALETKYLTLVDGGTKVYIEVIGETKDLKTMKENQSRPTLFISKINEISRDKKCSDN